MLRLEHHADGVRLGVNRVGYVRTLKIDDTKDPKTENLLKSAKAKEKLSRAICKRKKALKLQNGIIPLSIRSVMMIHSDFYY